ncbi:hypothetical protein [Candidatus Palauibacter sp.]|uniref:hypothetical protein n=1 Tax=Candidatus Palauibacter sp. TaxID=3101350 RepID=UPI003C6F5621
MDIGARRSSSAARIVAGGLPAFAGAWAIACSEARTGPEPGPPTPPPTPNRPPAPVGAIPGQEVAVGDALQVAVSSYFTDPDGDPLTFDARFSNPGVATAAAAEDLVTLAALAPGAATITLTATDPAGLETFQSFEARVLNHPPGITATLPDLHLESGEEHMPVLSRFFADPDGDAINFSATSSDETRVSVTSSTDTVWIRGESEGTARITVSATDAPGLSAAGVHLGVGPREHRTERRDLQPPAELRRPDHDGGRCDRGRTADPVHRREHGWPPRNPGLRGPVHRPLE